MHGVTMKFTLYIIYKFSQKRIPFLPIRKIGAQSFSETSLTAYQPSLQSDTTFDIWLKRLTHLLLWLQNIQKWRFGSEKYRVWTNRSYINVAETAELQVDTATWNYLQLAADNDSLCANTKLWRLCQSHKLDVAICQTDRHTTTVMRQYVIRGRADKGSPDPKFRDAF